MSETGSWPTGAVTFLFSDIEDSTSLWERHRSAMQLALAEHDRILREAVADHGGVMVKTTGDGIHAAFGSPRAALEAAIAAQRALQDEGWPTISPDAICVRMGLHTGDSQLREGDYYGTAVNRAARVMSIAHGGQMLASGTTAALLRANLPNNVTLLDLGEHTLKGLSRTAHIHQVQVHGLPHEFPPLRTGGHLVGNLPEPLTSFVGREKELVEVKALLSEARLLTLTGPGGTGKTRLSLEAGRALQDTFEHGVWLTELAPLSEGELIPATVAALFGLIEQPGRPALDTLIDYLRGKRLLLILDNCEHLVVDCAELAAALLPVAPGVTILASSREGLGTPGETTFHIPAMGVPDRDVVDRDSLAQYEAVQLFVARAQAVQSSFALTKVNAAAVGQIVRRLDGIPLAIELAAARVRLLSPQKIADRLDDRFRLLTGGSRTALPRQQTLRALIDWSYDLLSEDERWFMRQMSVFAGGWTLEAAEFVVARSIDLTGSENLSGLDALDLLANLVNKSLVQVDDSGDEIRYGYLETIRQYAREKLVESGEGPEARARQFAFVMQVADEDDEDGSLVLADLDYLGRIAAELDNLRAALEWGETEDPVAAINLFRQLVSLWSAIGRSQEGIQTILRLLDKLEGIPVDTSDERRRQRMARAIGLGSYATMAAGLGGGEAPFAAISEAIEIRRQHEPDSMELGRAIWVKALLSAEIDPQGGYEAAQESLAASRRHNNLPMQQAGLVVMAALKLGMGDLTVAADHLQEARELRTQLKWPVLIMQHALIESIVYRFTGNITAALAALEEGKAALRTVATTTSPIR